ncbi:MAG: hypothetical protein JW954_04840 [Dehalococcoidaceae bacterium]|nr:hypothetical protein [Dehalococcoidaceae bacterium]
MMNRIWKPAVYQGSKRMKTYFEGWYYKMVDAGCQNAVAVIPGVSFERSGQAHAFIQLAGSKLEKPGYFRFPVTDFRFSRKEFSNEIAGNRFGLNYLELDAGGEDGSRISGRLEFENLSPWPVSPLSPGAMGPFAFVPFMQCHHGIISMDHDVKGSLQIGTSNIDFSGGRGYMEKDWGRSFPSYHIWAQSNHFNLDRTSFMLSLANVPWLGMSFDGFIAGLLFEGKLYRFATYTGARLAAIEFGSSSINVHIRSRQHHLEISLPVIDGIALKTPVGGAMGGTLHESLDAVIHLKLKNAPAQGGGMIFEGSGTSTGLEIAGNITKLKQKWI